MDENRYGERAERAIFIQSDADVNDFYLIRFWWSDHNSYNHVLKVLSMLEKNLFPDIFREWLVP